MVASDGALHEVVGHCDNDHLAESARDVCTHQWRAGRAEHSEGLPTVAEVIEQLGFGLAQLRASLIGGGVYLADGAELLLISSVATSVADEWRLSALGRGLLVTLVFLGMLVGNLLSGPMSEAYGRRKVLNVSLVGLGFFSLMSSYAVGYWSLSCIRLVVGACIGLGQPAWNSLGTEIMPSTWRIWATTGVFWQFTLGEIYTCALLMADDPSLDNLHWRSLLRWGALPACVLSMMCIVFLNESPVYLAMHGHHDEAMSALSAMRKDNRALEVSIEFCMPEDRASSSGGSPSIDRGRTCLDVLRRQLAVVFGRNLWASTAIVMYSCFMVNFTYYGCLYAFPQVLKSVLPSRSAASELLVGALWEFPGTAAGFLIGMLLPRKFGMKVYLLSSSIALVAFVMGASAIANGSTTSAMDAFLYSGYYGIKSFGNAGFAILYTYAAELYPTEARTTGTAITLAGGRSGAMLAPLVFEALSDATGAYQTFFCVIILGSLLNALLVDMLKYETANTKLKDCVDDDREAFDFASMDRPRKVPGSGSCAYGSTSSPLQP